MQEFGAKKMRGHGLTTPCTAQLGQHVEAYIKMEGDRFQNLKLTEEMVRKEAGAVYVNSKRSVKSREPSL